MEKIAVELDEGTNMAISDNGMSQKTNKEINEILLPLAKKTLSGKTFGNDNQIYNISEIIDVTSSMIKMRFEVRCIASSYKLTSNGVKYTPPAYETFLVNEHCELCNELHEILDFNPYRDLLIKRNSLDIQDINGKIIEKGCHAVFEINGKTMEGEIIGYCQRKYINY